MSSETEPRNEVNLIQEVLEPLCKATSRHESYSQSWERVLTGRSRILFKGKKRFHFQFHSHMFLQSVSEYYLYRDGELRRWERDRRPGHAEGAAVVFRSSHAFSLLLHNISVPNREACGERKRHNGDVRISGDGI